MDKCLCRKMLNIGDRPIYVHLMGCPEDYKTKEYDALPWYKKIFNPNPRKLYQLHKELTGIY